MGAPNGVPNALGLGGAIRGEAHRVTERTLRTTGTCTMEAPPCADLPLPTKPVRAALNPDTRATAQRSERGM